MTLPHKPPRAVLGVLIGALLGATPVILHSAGAVPSLLGQPQAQVAGFSPPECGPSPNPPGSSLNDGQSFAAGNGLIAYEANCRGTRQVFVTLPSGAGARPITTNGGEAPAWSPDGQSIAFERGPVQNPDIYRRTLSGGEIRLTNDPAPETSPSWSPDGRRIVFARDGRLFLMDAVTGGNVGQLTFDAGPESDDIQPSWSPAGDRIAFSRANAEGSGSRALWTIRPDGSGLTRVTQVGVPTSRAMVPSWSPDGQQLVFSGGFPCSGGHQLFLIDADGLNARRLDEFLPPESCLASNPVFSPDGTRLLFSLLFRCPCPGGGFDNPKTGIYSMRPDGSDFRPVILDPTAGNPSWQPVRRAVATSIVPSSTSSTSPATTSTTTSTSTSSTSTTSTTTLASTTTTSRPPVSVPNNTCASLQAALARIADPAQRAQILALARSLGCTA